MNSDEQMVYAALSTDPEVVSRITTYSGSPAVFNGVAPQDAELPYVIFQTISVAPWDTLDEIGFDNLVDIRCYALQTGSMQLINSLAEACRMALHRTRPVMAGRQVAGVWAMGGPNDLRIEEQETGQFLVGKIITVRIRSTPVAA